MGGTWNNHRGTLLHAFKGLLGSKKAVLGLCFDEVGNSDDLLTVEDQKRFSEVIDKGLMAAEFGSPQIFWVGKTVTAWAPSCKDFVLTPLTKMRGVDSWRRAERFKLRLLQIREGFKTKDVPTGLAQAVMRPHQL